MRLGLLSTANINEALLGGKPDGVEIAAVASRDASRAQAYAREHGIGRAHGSYEELLADDELDAVYIPLPNGMHHEWTLKAIDAGKHVLVEKPYSRHAAEAEEAWDAAGRAGVIVMEAFMWRHHPQAAAALALVEQGRIGRLREIRTTFSFPLFDHENVRMVADLDGGALMDVGCYCISGARLLGGEPERVFGEQVVGPTGVDVDFYGSCASRTTSSPSSTPRSRCRSGSGWRRSARRRRSCSRHRGAPTGAGACSSTASEVAVPADEPVRARAVELRGCDRGRGGAAARPRRRGGAGARDRGALPLGGVGRGSPALMLPELAAELVAVDSVNPTLVPDGGGEAAVAAVCSRSGSSARGSKSRSRRSSPGRPNVDRRRAGQRRRPDAGAQRPPGHGRAARAGRRAGAARRGRTPVRPRRLRHEGEPRGDRERRRRVRTAWAARRRDRGRGRRRGGGEHRHRGAARTAGAPTRRSSPSRPTSASASPIGAGSPSTSRRHGRAAHGSRPDLGIDAIAKMGPHPRRDRGARPVAPVAARPSRCSAPGRCTPR